ncbi:egg cell-secreted protein 1.1-like [Rhododendron vialii]|uniref:egg cell-secreted protein 1.1-like n=1 Tax=Rhododendron vialii TaxID=182163 RepID=UPI00265EC276|nr:egg cell-secreted protein 1.1-like [Rhododendron vialii]
MVSKLSNSLFTLTVVMMITAAILEPPGLAMLVPGFKIVPDIMDCWASVIKSHGCITQMYVSLCKNKFGSIGPACCRAITSIKHTCWPRMLPFHPKFPLLAEGYCANYFGFMGSQERVDSMRMGNCHKFLFLLGFDFGGDYRGEDIGFSMS